MVNSSLYFTDPAIRHLAVEVDVGGAKILVINFYIPQVSSVPGFVPNLGSVFGITRDVLVVRGFNAHAARWHFYTMVTGAAARGNAVCIILDFGKLMCINKVYKMKNTSDYAEFRSPADHH